MDEYSEKNKEFINNSHKHCEIKNKNNNKYLNNKNNINNISKNNNPLKEYFLNLANQNDEDEERDFDNYDN